MNDYYYNHQSVINKKNLDRYHSKHGEGVAKRKALRQYLNIGSNAKQRLKLKNKKSKIILEKFLIERIKKYPELYTKD